ncbi:unnamed protein product [Mycena citricolor]|uniref:Uncharacterized protein n=1 Tax=Mycena citricolor TaxID=2018698 RepID=A0AAD2HNG4_9AGAR|nr:unnamed protein product [Mycena citricolor]
MPSRTIATPAMPHTSPLFSPSFQIIVVPPEEDLEPEQVVFHTDSLPEPDLATSPDFASLDQALARIKGTDPTPSTSRGKMNEEIQEALREGDSEIVEVVKVRRTFSPDAESAPPLPETKTKTKSLRSRAGSAFRSIKNLARATSRSATTAASADSRPYTQEVFAFSQSTQATFATAPLPSAPPLSRRGSVILSNLFRNPSRTSDSVIATSSTSDFQRMRYSADFEDDEDELEEPISRAPSPSPSMQTFTSTVRRRLSILSFQRKAPPRPVSPPSLSRGSTDPSTSSAPQTPTEETHPQPSAERFSKEVAPLEEEDPDRTIGEMRLDSFHFDGLSFDAEQF